MTTMHLTEAQQEWFNSLAAAGDDLSPRALRWAQESYWAGIHATLAGVVGCLEADLEEDGDYRPLKSAAQARLYLKVLKVACRIQAAEERAQAAEQEAATAARLREEEDARARCWGTPDAAEAARQNGFLSAYASAERRDNHAALRTVKGQWDRNVLRASVTTSRGSYEFLLRAPGGVWEQVSGPNMPDPSDSVSGWCNAYGD